VKYAPNGITGLIMLHKPIWRSDWRLFGQLIRPYLSAFFSLVVAAIGIIAYFEMIYFLTDETTRGTVKNLYGIEVNLTNFFTWFVFGVFGIIGIVLCRAAFPRVRQHWNNIMDSIRMKDLQ
jgi:branched-chain amino acid transport system permease protein